MIYKVKNEFHNDVTNKFASYRAHERAKTELWKTTSLTEYEMSGEID